MRMLLCLIALGSYHLEAWRSVQVMAKRLFASALSGSLLIVVSVTLDTVAQVQGHLIAQQYEGLIKKSKLRGGKRGR